MKNKFFGKRRKTQEDSGRDSPSLAVQTRSPGGYGLLPFQENYLPQSSGELRLSNFLLWQAAYAELYSTDVLWPDFNEKELDKALEAYASRSRRFGGV